MIVLNMALRFIDFFSYRKVGFLFSVIFIIATIFGYSTLGLNLGIDFKGGIIAEIAPSDDKFTEVIKELLLIKNKDITVQLSGGNIILRLQNANQHYDSKNINFIKEDILEVDKGAQFLKIDYVGPKVTKDLIKNAIQAFFGALLVVMLYILVRFNWKFSVGAILSLFHDVIASIGFFVFIRYEFNLTSVAAILTIIGYSVNDSVVIFDRMRENMGGKQTGMTPRIVNQSINETLSRTVMTFLTTFVACVALWGFGGDNLKSFGAIITFGITFGTYSSIFVSTNLLPYLDRK